MEILFHLYFIFPMNYNLGFALIVRKYSGETLDLKAYEADMRHLIDNYIPAEEPNTISQFGDLTLLEVIVKSGLADALNTLPKGIKGSQQAVSEIIKNNVRRKIIRN